MTIRPRRSVLYMPGSNARAMEKARELPADAVIFDLEDAVAPDAKAKARELIVQALQKGGFGSREVVVRINGLDTAWWLDDLAVAAAGPDAILVPKVSTPQQLREVGKHLVGVSKEKHVRVWAMMETPLAMLNAGDIAAAALDPETRLSGFVMGTNDLAKDTRARLVPGRAPMLPWLMNCVAAARAFGLDILDGVYNDLGNAEGFAAECRQARDLGFDGKTLIHPQQIAPCNDAFSPGAEEVAWSRKIIAAFELPENTRQGRHPGRRPHGRDPACRDGAADGGDRRRYRAEPGRIDLFVQSRVNTLPADGAGANPMGDNERCCLNEVPRGGVLDPKSRGSGYAALGRMGFGVLQASRRTAASSLGRPNARSASRWFAFTSIRPAAGTRWRMQGRCTRAPGLTSIMPLRPSVSVRAPQRYFIHARTSTSGSSCPIRCLKSNGRLLAPEKASSLYVFNRYPVLKIHHTMVRQTARKTRIAPALMPTLTSERSKKLQRNPEIR